MPRDRRPAWRRAARRSRRTIAQELGMPIEPVDGDPGRAADDDVHVRCPTCVEAGRVGGGDRQLARRARAGRRGRRDHAVELPAAPDRGQGRARARRRLHRRAEAERGRAAERVHPRRDHRRGRAAGRRVQPRDRLRARSWARRSPAHPGVDMVSFTGSTRAGQAGQRARRAGRSSGSRSSSAASRRT